MTHMAYDESFQGELGLTLTQEAPPEADSFVECGDVTPNRRTVSLWLTLCFAVALGRRGVFQSRVAD